MYRMAFRWTQNQADAEDVVQEVLTNLAGRLDEMESIENLKSWLIKVLYNKFVDRYRQQNRRLELPEIDFGLPTLSESGSQESLIDTFADCESTGPSNQAGLQMTLQKAVGILETSQRDVLLLHDAEGYSDSEIAEILDISKGTVKSRLHRARRKVKKFINRGTIPRSASCKAVKESKSHVL